nr:MAG TPA: bacterial surface protein [Caudoviricetes sp.]
MKYMKNKYADEDGNVVSFWSTDDNILCEDGKTLRENLDEVDTQFKDIAKEIDNITTVGGGLSYTAKKAILDLFGAVAYYNEDISSTYQILKDALLVAVDSITLDKTELTFTSATSQTLIATKSPIESEGILVWTSSNTSVATVDDNGVVTATGNGECTITVTCGSVYATCNVSVSGILATYSITNNLTNVTTSNNIDNIAEGTGYIATLTANSNYIISSVTITMGGEDITSTAYSNGAISISSVTGNIVIKAIAVEDVGWISGVPYNITWTEGYTINSTDGSNTENSNFCVSDYLPCHGANRLSTFDYSVYFYDKNKSFLTKSENAFIPDEKNIHVPDTAYYVRVNKRNTNTSAILTPYLDNLLTDSTAYNVDKFYRLNWKDGYNVNSSTGEETTAVSISLSDFALCYGATLLQISYGGRMFIHCYNENKNYLGTVTRQNATTATSLLENTKYFRLSVANLTANFWVKLS